MARHGLRTLVTALIIATLLPAAAAFGDGDPASDVLLGENVFYPYSPPVPGSLQKTLDAETAAAKRLGFPIKVALIGSPVDLGVIPDLFGQPQKYAEFLDQEISFRTRQPLLVVMATGYGLEGLPAKATAAAGSLPKPEGKTPSELATAAITVVGKLAESSGHPIRGVPGVPGVSSASGGGSGSTIVIVAALAVAALAVATALVVLRRRERAGSR